MREECPSRQPRVFLVSLFERSSARKSERLARSCVTGNRRKRQKREEKPARKTVGKFALYIIQALDELLDGVLGHLRERDIYRERERDRERTRSDTENVDK